VAEQGTHKPLVVGSNPTLATKIAESGGNPSQIGQKFLTKTCQAAGFCVLIACVNLLLGFCIYPLSKSVR
jgi:hypothetical protein